MKNYAICLALLAVVFCPTLMAQENSAAGLFDSPVKVEAELQNLGESVRCSLPLTASSGLFGATEIKHQTPNEFLVNEFQGSFTVYRFSSDCNLIDSWTTAFPSATMTGITYDTVTQNTYWAADPQAGMIREFEMVTGIPTGNTHLFPNVGVNAWGPGAINEHQAGRISYWQEITSDEIHEIDLDSGAVNCSFLNPDHRPGLGAYGNGLDDAANQSLNDTDLVIAGGLIADGQVTGTHQTDCSGSVYENTWDLQTPLSGVGETFPNGIVEYNRNGAIATNKNMMVVGNATSTVFVLEQDMGIEDCQGVDAPTSNILFTNGYQGGSEYTVNVAQNDPLAFTIQKPGDQGNGKYVVHMNAGFPTAETIRPLPANLGLTCFPFLSSDFSSPSSVWNNIGKPEIIGASNYFGTFIEDPERAPAFFHLAAQGDTANMPAGSDWTTQAIIFNPAASSPKGASVSNAIQLRIE